ncbi:MAG TPA: beta-L-arabinofuranosidase domain-containing protein [Bryobacteraceae bacterium]
MCDSITRITRRQLAGALAAAPALLAQQTSPQPITPPQRRGPVPEVPPFEGPIEFARKDVPPKVKPFPMTAVKLLPGPFADAAEWNRAYMERLPADKLLFNFRANAGLSTGTSPGFTGGGTGNWERPADGQHGTELRGHFTGHFLSASAQLYASGGDQKAKAKGDELVAELAKCQDKLGGGYLSAFPMELFDRLDSLSGKPRPIDPATGQPQRPQPGEPQLPWAPFYTIHKIMAGLFDMYTLAGNQQALKVVSGMADWADQWSAAKSEEHMQQILNTEYGGIAETLYNLSAVTHNDRWATAGDRFTKKRFVNPLASRRDELRGLHVNTHIPQVIAAARRYEISGDTRFHDVADYFWYEVVSARSYVTAGTSNGEIWQAPPRQLAAELKTNVDTAECCCAYNMLKLTRHLYGWTGDPRYFDYYERSMLNHRLGTILPEKGYTQYYLSLTPGAWKTFSTEDQSFWCCTGSGVEEYSKLNDSIYWHDQHGVFVNLFIPSELDWKEKSFRLRQETKFPEQPGTSLVVSSEKPIPLALRLRVPAWLESAPLVKLNGRVLESSADPGSYLTISRTWKKGDRIDMSLPMALHMEAMPDNPGTQAFLYGPLVLAGDLGSEGLTDRLIIGPSGPRLGSRAGTTPPVPPLDIPTFHAAGADPASWIKPAGKPLTFRTSGQRTDVTLVPLNSIFGKRYSVYWQVS